MAFYRWYQGFVVDPDLGTVDSAGWIAAIEMTPSGSKAVLIKPDGTKVDNPGYRDGVNDKDVAWSPDGNRLFFSSDREKGVFQIARWNPSKGNVEVRSVGSRSKARLNFSPPGYVSTPTTGLIVAGGFVLEFDPRGGTTRQVLPPTTGVVATGEEGGSQGQFDAYYRNLGQSFREAKYGKDRKGVFAVIRRDLGEALIYQPLELIEDAKGNVSLPRPQGIVAADSIEFDVNSDGLLAYTVRGFRFFDPANAPEAQKRNGELVPPYRNALFTLDVNAQSVTPMPVFVSPDDEIAAGQVVFNPTGGTLLFQSGRVNKLSQFEVAGMLSVVVDGEGLKSAQQLTRGLVSDFSWSPDGNRIVFVMSKDGQRGLYTIKPDGAALEPLGSLKGDFDDPKFSPAKPK